MLRHSAHLLAALAEVCGSLVIAYGVVRAVIQFVLDAVRGPAQAPHEAIRLTLGRSLVLGLEFLLAADILNTAVAPTWEQVALLAAIAAIRTALNYFLERDLERADDRAQSGVALGARATRPAEPPERDG